MSAPNPSMESVEEKRTEWEENRRRVIERLIKIADVIEGWSVGGKAANIAGSSLGIIGGSFILGGLAFPPLLVAGIVITLIGAGGNVGTSITRFAVVKNLAEEAQKLCEEDARLLKSFIDEAEAFMQNFAEETKRSFVDEAEGFVQLGAGVGGAASATAATLRALVPILRKTFITVPNAVGGTSLKALIPAAATAPIHAIAGVTAGIGMAIDVVSLIMAATSLAMNESDELAVKLRDIADRLQKELDDVSETTQDDEDNNNDQRMRRNEYDVLAVKLKKIADRIQKDNNSDDLAGKLKDIADRLQKERNNNQ